MSSNGNFVVVYKLGINEEGRGGEVEG